MTVSLLIYITGKPLIHGYKRREFLWSQAHNLYLFQGKEWSPKEFNDAWAAAMRRNEDLRPMVKVLTSDTANTSPPADASGLLLGRRPPTLDEALEVVKREAPEKLKKPAGRPPKAMAEAMAVA